LAVFVSAVAFYILGAIWYMPLFGHQWMALAGKTQTSPASMTSTFIISFILGWILAYVIGIALADTSHPNPARHGVEFGAFMGLGVFATMLLVIFLYEGRSLALWAIDAGYVVAGMAIMGAIVGAWRKKPVAAAQ
jgi:peptidoglycan/LPS O-acetylase OafA/YrhL